jgi:16S rRNA (uracil1498-N3)-methyltransferase
MSAQPAWPLDSGIRLFVDQPLSLAQSVPIEGAQAHYLLSVMRVKPGAHLLLFDDRTGEWRALVSAIGKRTLTLIIEAFVRPRERMPDLWLAAAPIRRARFDWVAEKACELGVRRFVPVETRRAVVDKVKDSRLRAHMIEAAEQCGRTALPDIAPLTSLSRFLATLDDRVLFFADEEGGVVFVDAVLAHAGPGAILIGPEGGFTPEERDAVRAAPRAIGVSLGPRILRADTAAVAAVATWIALQR